jgi:hypothetical protein
MRIPRKNSVSVSMGKRATHVSKWHLTYSYGCGARMRSRTSEHVHEKFRGYVS